MKSQFKILLWLFSIMATGCNPYMYYYENLPPKIELDADQQSILFISQFDTSSFDFNQKKKISTFKKGYTRLVDGVVSGFDNFAIDINWQDSTDFALPPAGNSVPSSMVKQLCEAYQKDMLLSLENFDMGRNKTVEVEENNDGSKTRTAYFNVEAVATLNLYSKSGYLIDMTQLRGEKPIESREVLSGLLAVGPALGNQKEIIYPMLYRMGTSYVNNFKPRRIFRSEIYYAKGELAPVKEMIDDENWPRAKDFLVKVYNNSTDEKLRRRTAHNIYHVSLAMEDFAEAEQWLVKTKK